MRAELVKIKLPNSYITAMFRVQFPSETVWKFKTLITSAAEFQVAHAALLVKDQWDSKHHKTKGCSFFRK